MKFFIKFYFFLEKSLTVSMDKVTQIIQNDMSRINNDMRDNNTLTLCGMYTINHIGFVNTILLMLENILFLCYIRAMFGLEVHTLKALFNLSLTCNEQQS